MKNKPIAILLLLAIILGNVGVYAAPGDIIHTGLKKIYTETEEDQIELSEDILKHIEDEEFTKKFYKEVEGGKYINLVKEENQQIEALEQLLQKAYGKGEVDLTDPDDINRFLKENADKVNEALKNIRLKPISFEEIPDGGNWEEYRYTSAAPLLDKSNYSTPEPGSQRGTTKVDTLNLPTGASRWLVKVFESMDKVDKSLEKDTVIKNATAYSRGRNIEADFGNVLGLYAVDNANRLKAYVHIKLTHEMINAPRELAPQEDMGSIVAGKKYAGAIKIDGLEENTKYHVLISNIPVNQVYKDMDLSSTIEYTGQDIVLANEEELHPIKDSFRKYIVLLKLDEEKQVKSYNSFEINKNNISIPPTKLIKTTHYIGPVPGAGEGTTKFSALHFGTYRDENMKEAKNWHIFISKDSISIPKLNGNINSLKGEKDKVKEIEPNEDIEANVDDYLLLTATDEDGNIKGYQAFNLTEDMVKGKIAPNLPDGNYREPTKGTIEGTTKIEYLNLEGITDAAQWMYKVGGKLEDPMFNRIVEGSNVYQVGDNIKANIGDTLLLLATDEKGLVKAFARFELDGNTLRSPSAILLKGETHYIGPVKGDKPGHTKFETLSGSESIGNNPIWMYRIYNVQPDIPEYDSHAIGTEVNPNEDIPAESGQYLLLMATDGSKIKGYALFRLTENHIRMPDAILLEEGTHYTKPEKGTMPGTTRIMELKYTGIEDVEQWRYRVDKKKYEGVIEYNSVLPGTSIYKEGDNIRAEAGDCLVLLATDKTGRVKGYAIIDLDEDNVRKPNATLLRPNTNYVGPEPGTEKNSTRFSFLNFEHDGEENIKWMYKVGDSSFGNIELDSIVEDSKEYTVGENILGVASGDHLLLLAADERNQVKAYGEFKLTERDVRGGPARELDTNNYTLEPGIKPGTTRFTKLLPLGLEGSIRWRYKLLDKELAKEEIPYLNSIVDGTYTVSMGQDIQVEQINGGYGYLLLLAVDGGGRTKGYAQIPLTASKIKEHAPVFDIQVDKGEKVDTVKLTNPISPEGTEKYKIILTNTPYPTPAKDEVVVGGMDYTIGDDIQVRLDQYLTVFAVDKENKIKGYRSFKIDEYQDKIKRGKAEIIKPSTILEGSVVNGGEKIIIELSNSAQWAEDIKTNSSKRDALYNGFRASGENTEWAKVVDALMADGSGAIDVSSIDSGKERLIISLPETKDYDITQDQIITLTIPAAAMKDAINPIEAEGSIIIKPTVKATISGDVVDSIVREEDIKAGGKTIVIELEDGDWLLDVDKDKLIDGFKVVDVDKQEDTQWSKIAKKITQDHITRNSSKKVTITLPEVGDVDFGVDKEIISLTIPAELVQGAAEDIVATPRFTLYPDILQVDGEAIGNLVYLESPDGRVPRENMDTWVIKVEVGTLKKDISDKDIVVAGLPRGLRANVDRVDVENNTIAIKVSGTAANKIEEERVSIRIKGTAVEEPNSMDSEDIVVMLKLSHSKIEDLERVSYRLGYKDDTLYIYLINVDEDMEYSINSTNGINGSWDKIVLETGKDEIKIDEAKPISIWVREAAQPKVYIKAVELLQEEAPGNIAIAHYDYDAAVVGLEGIESNIEYDYSLDGGNTWSKYEWDTKIPLIRDLDLRIRKAAIEGEKGKLPSKATGKLNGVYLRDAKLNVVKGIIENTTNSMEYSTNDGERFSRASNGITNVRFAVGDKVWIRERNNPNNIRYLDEVGQEEFTEDELDNIDFDIKEQKILLIDQSNMDFNQFEYKIANEPWQDVGEGVDIEFKAGELRFRKKGTETTLPSLDQLKETIKPPEAAPQLAYDDVKYSIEAIGTEAGSIYEYSINGGEWIEGDKSKEFKAGDEVRVRIAATKDKLSSQIQTIKFTPNLDFSNVYIDAEKSVIVNTTREMEYSINTTNGLDGEWLSCDVPNTKVPLKTGMNVWIREANKPTNYRRITTSPMEAKILDENMIKNRIHYSVKDRTIWANTENIDEEELIKLQGIVDQLQYRNGDEHWTNIGYVKLKEDKDRTILAYNINFRPGRIEFRLKGDRDKLPSKPVLKTTIKAKASAPNVIVDHGQYRVVSINGLGRDKDWDAFEYRIDNGPWISGRYLKDEYLIGEKRLTVRFKATDTALPSQEREIQFTEKIPLDHVILSDYVHPLELNGTTTDMEYGIWLGDSNNNWQYNGEWFSCDSDNTKLPEWLKKENLYKIIIRDRNQPSNQYSVYPQE